MPDHDQPHSQTPAEGPAPEPDRVDVTGDYSGPDPAAPRSVPSRFASPAERRPIPQMLDEIAHGGMGVIWRATDTTLGREVVLRPCLAAGRVRRRRRLIPDPAGRNRRATARFRRGMRIRGWE